MTDYDRRAWAEIQEWKDKRLHARVGRRMPESLRKKAAAAGQAARRGAHVLPGSEKFEQLLKEGLESLFEQGFDLAVASVRTEKILAAYRAAGFEARVLPDIRALDLADIDRVKPNLALSYASVALIEGAGAGFAITGGEALTVTGAGPAMVVGVMVGDAAATLVGSLRLVAHTAAYYGFDTLSGDEQETAFSLGVLGVGVARRAQNKAAAYRELSRVKQLLAQRRFKWLEKFGKAGKIPKSRVTELITRVLTQLGFKATAQNVEKLLPVVGIGIGAGQNAAIFRRVASTADRLYRERWLAERYGLTASVPDVPEDGEAVPIAEILDEVEAEILEDWAAEEVEAEILESPEGEAGPESARDKGKVGE
ncbi:EcsC family protein [Streptomyces polygonati]|uniref:EcsC family protein n=1 Tax=Streptomyces polygonati TaxID=1617087 RepID=A0ABV8HMI3_9ACTN